MSEIRQEESRALLRSSVHTLLPASLIDELSTLFLHATGSARPIEQVSEVSGGLISSSYRLQTADNHWFLKLNAAEQHSLFEAESDGLNALAGCSEIRVPRVVAHSVCERQSYLLLEFIALNPLNGSHSIRDAGYALAALHRIGGERFGWHRPNYIGSTPQINAEADCWPTFFATRRLRPQLDLVARRGFSGRVIADGERLLDKVGALFPDYIPFPSLLHGDLWSGNAAVDDNGKLTLFDPAVYFGDRESDLAMMSLFGFFPEAMLFGYREAWPLTAGFEHRRTLYQLYHVLNHLNLFGASYLSQAEQMISRLLAEIG